MVNDGFIRYDMRMTHQKTSVGRRQRVNVALPNDATMTRALDDMAASLNVTRAELVEALVLATASAWAGEAIEKWDAVEDEELDALLDLEPSGPRGTEWWGKNTPAGYLEDVRTRAWLVGQRNRRARSEAARTAGRAPREDAFGGRGRGVV